MRPLPEPVVYHDASMAHRPIDVSVSSSFGARDALERSA
jgi:hypothetical protein